MKNKENYNDSQPKSTGVQTEAKSNDSRNDLPVQHVSDAALPVAEEIKTTNPEPLGPQPEEGKQMPIPVRSILSAEIKIEDLGDRKVLKPQGEQLVIPVKSPSSDSYFMTRAGWSKVFHSLIVQGKSYDKKFYILAPDIVHSVPKDKVKIRCFTAYLDIGGSVSIWPHCADLTSENGDETSIWGEGARRAYDYGLIDWVQVYTETGKTGYRCRKINSDSPDFPDTPPEWPDCTFGELLDKAFKGRFIDMSLPQKSGQLMC